MSLDLEQLGSDVDARLADADAALAAQFPGERAGRQPIHTVYVSADRMHTGLVPDWGAPCPGRARRARRAVR